MLTGAKDGRVNPMQSRKFAAALQAATSSGLPILLRTSANSGHGIGSSLNERIAEQTDHVDVPVRSVGHESRRAMTDIRTVTALGEPCARSRHLGRRGKRATKPSTRRPMRTSTKNSCTRFPITAKDRRQARPFRADDRACQDGLHLGQEIRTHAVRLRHGGGLHHRQSHVPADRPAEHAGDFRGLSGRRRLLDRGLAFSRAPRPRGPHVCALACLLSHGDAICAGWIVERVPRVLFAQRRPHQIVAVSRAADGLLHRQRGSEALPLAPRFHDDPVLLRRLHLRDRHRARLHAHDREVHVSGQRRDRHRRPRALSLPAGRGQQAAIRGGARQDRAGRRPASMC